MRMLGGNRRGLFLGVLISLTGLVSPSEAQSTFSATGTFSASSGQTEDFGLHLGSTSDLTFRTWAHNGGANAMGQSIPAGGIDSTLTFFDNSNATIAFNDDINTGAAMFDSLLSYLGSGTTLLAAQPAGDYRLRLANFSNTVGNGAWAIDLVNSFDTMTLNAATASANSVLNTLAIGGNAMLSVGNGSTFAIASNLDLYNSASINISSGSLLVGQAFYLHGGSVIQSGGYVNTGYTWVLRMSGTSTYTLNGGTLVLPYGVNFGDNGGGVANFVQNGGTVNSSSGNLVVGIGNTSIYTLNNGYVQTATYYLGSGGTNGQGTLIQNGGSIDGGYLNVGAGTSEYLVTGGTAAFGTGDIGGGSSDYVNIAGGRVTFSGTLGLAAPGTVTVNGGALSAGTINNSGGGTLYFNFGTLALTSGGLDISAGGLLGNTVNLLNNRVLSVSGTTTIQPGSTLQISATTFSTGSLVNNGGQLIFNSGTIQFTGAPVTIGPGGPFGNTLQLSSGQNVVDTFGSPSNVGTVGLLYLTGGTFSANAGLNNAGQIQLDGVTSTLAGGTLNNSGLLSGTGRFMGSQITNQSGGEIRVASTDQLQVTSPIVNSGAINLFGGLLHAQSLTNNLAGRVSGRGQLEAPGGLLNNGTIQLSSGISDIFGPVTQNSGGKMIITGGSTTTFYNDVTNNTGSEFRVSTGSEAVFLGNVSGSGSFSGQGVKIFEGGGTLGPVDTVVGSSIVSATTSLTAARFRETSLEVDGTTHISPDGSSPGTSRVNTLNIAGSTDNWTGKLDLSNNDLVIDYSGTSPFADVANQIKSGRNNGAWNGNGITTSSGDLTHHTVGYAEASALGSTSFSGQSVDSTSVLVKYTWYGDSNLDGIVDIKDLYALALHYNTAGDLWTTGDYNNDGVVNVADLTLMALNWQAGVGAPLGPASLEAALANLGLPPVGVPEPTALAGLTGLCGLIARRRRRAGRFNHG